jgi:amino acid adenylation domain-containing protein
MKSVADERDGNSVSLRRVVSRDKQALIAKRLRGSKRPEIAGPIIPKINATEGPLSFGQQRFWFLEQLEPGQPVYHVCFGLRLTGHLDHGAVEAALTEIVQRHEALRTNFISRGGTPIQVVSAPRAVTVPVIELDQAEGNGETLRARQEAEAARPFDLTQDLLLRATLFRQAPNKHVLLFVMHHIATDAWSIRLLLEEWTALYDAHVRGTRAELPELPIQYSDFARWQRDGVEGETVRNQLAYWKEQLADAPVLQLPRDQWRPGIPSNRGATRSVALGPELSASLSRFVRQEGVTQFNTLLTAFKVLLQRYCGQDDIAVGTPISGRDRQQTENLIGLFLNISVLRTDLSGDPTFRQLVQRVRGTALEAYAHQHIPFERVVEELQPARAVSRTPLFQVMFTFQEEPRPLRTLEGGLQMEIFDLDLQVAPFDLTVFAQESDQGLLATIEYKTDLFSAGSIERMLGHFRTLLEGIVQNPDARISELPWVTVAERQQLLTEFNPPETDYPRDKCLHEFFEEQATRTPEAAAIRFGSHTVTYRELNERANQLAHYLTALGVEVETLVGICMERSAEMIIAVLAVLKAGGAYVPFEPDEAAERLAFKLRDSGIEVLLTQQGLVPALSDSMREAAGGLTQPGPEVVCLDRDHGEIGRHSRQNLPRAAGPNNLAYVIYTSGSTGTPKGVLIEHRSIVNHSVGAARQFGLTSCDRVLQFSPLSFDVSAEEIFPTLLTGGMVVLRPAGLAVSIQDFHPFVANEKLTVINLPTQYWGQWMTVIEDNNLQFPPSLRLVIVGSDTVTKEQYALWQKLTRGLIRWCNAYGTTEATITATIYEPREDESPVSVPIGRPTANTQVYLLDRHKQLVPIGVPGEIYIGGDEVARGYLNRPDATATNFVPDIFSKRRGAKLNRTGDFGRWRADGNIEFLGRRDNQVKIRGFRIELGEVESALLQHPAVREVVVLPREDGHGEKRLVAWLVADDTEGQLVGKLRQFLKQRLPAYMIPAAFVPLSELPRLRSGKLDANALPAPNASRPDLEESFVAPSDSLEEKLANVWRQVLGLEKVGVNDNFFDLGGHSLLAVRLFAEIEKLTGRSVPVLTLFQSPTIKQLAEIIRRTQSTERRSSILPVQAEGTKPPFFLVHGAGGGMLWGYANLSKHLGNDQPVYVFNSRGMDGLEEFSTVEELAAQYVRELRAFQPEGPYYLGGYCFGGEVAFEMAQQLLAQGERVGLLALANSMPPNSGFAKPNFSALWLMRFCRNSWHWFMYSRRWTAQQKRTFVQRKLRALKKRLCHCLRITNNTPTDAADVVDLSLYSEVQQRLWEVHLRASDNYRPKPYPGRIAVFRTRFHPFFCSFDPAFGWTEFAKGDLIVKIIPGGHESILDEPHVQSVAVELKELLAEAQAASQQPGTGYSPAQRMANMFFSSVVWLLEFAPAL